MKLGRLAVAAALVLLVVGCQGRSGSSQPPPVGTLGTAPGPSQSPGAGSDVPAGASPEVPTEELLGPYCGGYAVGVSAPGAGRTFPVDVRVCQPPAAGFQYWLVAESAVASGGSGSGSFFPKTPIEPAVGQIRTYPVVLGPPTPLNSVRFISVLRVPGSAAADFAELQRRDASSTRAAFPAGTEVVSNVYRSVLVHE